MLSRLYDGLKGMQGYLGIPRVRLVSWYGYGYKNFTEHFDFSDSFQVQKISQNTQFPRYHRSGRFSFQCCVSTLSLLQCGHIIYTKYENPFDFVNFYSRLISYTYQILYTYQTLYMYQTLYTYQTHPGHQDEP